MWPIQTLTLLLCLTDEEQLYAHCIPSVAGPVRTEMVIPAPTPLSEADALVLTLC